MKRFKSMLALLLAVVMVFALCSCGGGKDNTSDNGSSTGDGNSSTGDGSSSSGDSKANCYTLSNEEGYIYDNIVIGTNIFGNFQNGTSPQESDAACSLVFDLVFVTDPITKEVTSEILEDWHMEDGTTLIMKLKDNIYFSNGEKATSEDLLFAYENHIERGSNYLNNYFINFDESKCLDELTVSMKFDKFYTGFFNSFSIYLYDKSWAQEVGWDSIDWYAPVGSGPYICTEYAMDDHMTFVARDDYWNKESNPVAVKSWTIKYYADSSVMEMALETGDIALCATSTNTYDKYIENGGAEKADGYAIGLYDAGVVQTLEFSYMDTDVFKDKRVREAFAYGINWKELGEICNGTSNIPIDSFVPESSPEYISLGEWEYDIEKAKDLLNQAGYNENNPLVISTTLMDISWYKSIGEAFQFYASLIGVDVKLEFADISGALNAWISPGGTDFCFLYNNLGSVGAQLCRSLDQAADEGACTFAFIDNQEFIDAYMEAAYSADSKHAIEMSKKAQQILHDEVLGIPISVYSFRIGYNTALFNEESAHRICMCSEYYNLATASYASFWN